MGYIDAREHSGGERHFDVDWSPIIEDLYSSELGFMDICVARSDFVHSLDTPSLGQSRGEISPVLREIEHGSTSCYSGSVYDCHPPPPPVPTVPQSSPYVLHGHSEVAPPAVVQTIVVDDAHARMDRLDSGMPVASLPAKFRMPDIERYTGIGCPRLHLRLYSTVMRAHGLDESQMITLFLLSLSGAARRWFVSLESSRRRTWDDLAREFLRQFSFNTVVDVSRRKLEALRQRSDESISSFISH
uniref:Retrotransposon gag domain-containing protein n=1 Tax=Vitis vinifera TaxID=29760 RepID=A5BAW8_VITVI|nr:hypothetical protein VITISV_042356 [Vitis vinifera]